MKLVIEKNLNSGKYSVTIKISEYTEDEIVRLRKFGSPPISILPRQVYFDGKFTSQIPLTDMDLTFTFDAEQQANDFVDIIKDRVITAVTLLKNRTDKFSGGAEIVL